MHLLGKTIKSYAITPTSDTIKFANIPHWDFHWQDFYFFKHMQKVPQGSKIKGVGVYDNTATNEHNPNNPPVMVTAGLNTNDEMFLVYFHYMLYQNGDENTKRMIAESWMKAQNEKSGKAPKSPSTAVNEALKGMPIDEEDY